MDRVFLSPVAEERPLRCLPQTLSKEDRHDRRPGRRPPSSNAPTPPPSPERAFSLLYRPAGARGLLRADMALLRSLTPFDLEPARDIPNYHGQPNRTGWYASTRAGAHLRFESGLERLRMQFLDFDPGVTTFASQPFTLEWTEGGKVYRYTPDLLIVRAGRPRVVEDVKPAQFHGSPKLQRAFNAAREALTPIGVEFRLWAPPETTVVRNVQYLAGYRHRPSGLMTHVDDILAALRERPHTLADLAERTGTAALTRPVIYHLIWAHRITADLTQPLSHGTRLARTPQPGEAA